MLDLGGDVLEARWWKRAGLVADYVLRRLRTQVYEHKLQFNLALLDYNTSETTFALHHRQAEIARNSIVHELMPWLEIGPKTIQASMEAMRKQYLKYFADPRSEKGKEAIRKQLMRWRSSHARRFLAKR